LNILNYPDAKCINDFRGARPGVDLSGYDIDAGAGGDANAAMDPGRRSIGAERRARGEAAASSASWRDGRAAFAVPRGGGRTEAPDATLRSATPTLVHIE